jgi:hypothetical protein
MLEKRLDVVCLQVASALALFLRTIIQPRIEGPGSGRGTPDVSKGTFQASGRKSGDEKKRYKGFGFF